MWGLIVDKSRLRQACIFSLGCHAPSWYPSFLHLCDLLLFRCLISYLTAGETETRAWTITKGTKAPKAAGKIHSDFERGFIKAEVVYYEDLLQCGSYNAAKEKGLVRMEGKEYVVKSQAKI